MITGNRLKASALALATAMLANLAAAQENEDSSSPDDGSNTSKVLGTVTVTATKKAGGTDVQDTPISIVAFGSEQLDALQVRDITDLGFKTPNVAMDDIGTTKGVANFTIRGLGVNSSIPSIDPAVGVFVDGIYLGMNAGVIMDTFDLETVEVLRGPQGVLFGRNVTGGAVLINTADPSNEYQVSAKTAVESGFRGTGLNKYAQAVITGPLVEDVLSAKLGVYYNDDDGWFKNSFTGQDHGASKTLLVRPSIKWTPNDTFETMLKFEHGESEGDGPASQNHRNGFGVDGQIVNFDRESFDFSIDHVGDYDSEWNQLVSETNINVDFGDGVITNILGYREFEQFGSSDIDATPTHLFPMSDSFEPLLRGDIDVLLTYVNTPPSHPNLRIDELCRLNVYALMRKGHPAPIRNGYVQLKDIAPYEQIFSSHQRAFSMFHGIFTEAGISPQSFSFTNISSGTQALVGRSDCISLRIARPAHTLSPLGDELSFPPLKDNHKKPILIAASLSHNPTLFPSKISKFVSICENLFADGTMRQNYYY